jgi:enoyl-CoA hydratase
MSTAEIEPTVLASRRGRVGHILLNRPRALNALDTEMVLAASAALDLWRDDPAVHAVVIEGAGGRAFCAGGDIRAVRAASLAGQHDVIAAFFVAEYGLNQAIADYPKPFIALVDGICMGGGIGVSVHGWARVVTDAAMFAMPETGIALFPDIGATYILPRLRGQIGLYMALAGARLHGADAAFAGLATHYTSRETIAGLAAALAEHGPAALAGTGIPLDAPIASHMDAIDRCFSADSVAAILQRLEAEGTDWSRETLAAIRAASPSAVLWTFEIVRAGAGRTLPQCLAAELALTRHATVHPDFIEGVRAMVIDKDRKPKWSAARIEDVDPASIARMFA